MSDTIPPPPPTSVILMRIEKLLQAQLQQMAALHTDLSQLLAVLVHKTSNGKTEDHQESESQ